MPDDTGKDDTGNMLRLEKATIGINVLAALALTILIALVADVRGSIATMAARVETAIRDVAVLQSQGLDGRIRDIERRTATLEAQRRTQGGER